MAALLLTAAACGPDTAVTPETAAPPSAAATGAPAVSSAPSVPGVQSGLVVLPNGPLPQEAYAAPGAPPRLYPELTYTLLPRDDYGRLWPYVGGYAAAWWMTGELYGLCDEAGRIVVDPVFNRVEILEKDGKKLYKLTENLADAEGKDVSKITLAALDGSWAKQYEGVAYQFPGSEYFNGSIVQWRPDFVYDNISVSENGRWGVIDYEGKEILPSMYNNPVCFSEGLAAVVSEDGETYNYIDRRGNKVLGPYKTAPQQLNNLPMPIYDPLIVDVSTQTLQPYYGLFFSEGLARFYKNGRYGVVDKRGVIVIQAQYDFITSFYKGTAEFLTGHSYDDLKYGLVDTAGRVLVEPQGVRLLPEDGDGTDASSGASYSQGSDGVVIYCDDGPQSFPDAVNVTFLDNGKLALSRRDNTWDIVDRSGTRVAGPFDGRADNYRDGLIYVYTACPTCGTYRYVPSHAVRSGRKQAAAGGVQDGSALDGRYLCGRTSAPACWTKREAGLLRRRSTIISSTEEENL